MLRPTLALLIVAVPSLGVVPSAQAAPTLKPPGVLRVCGNGAPTDVFIDRGELHKEKRGLADGKCKNFKVPKGKYAVTVTAACTNARDARLADVAVSPTSRALYHGTSLGGARVVRESTTTWTSTWECTGINQAVPPGQPTPPPFR